MDTKRYKLVYLPLFLEDMNRIVDYISITLNNPEAADRLIDDVRQAIHVRLQNPESNEKWASPKQRALPYYRIYVRNYIVFYVVYDQTMEVRRILYKRQDWTNTL